MNKKDRNTEGLVRNFSVLLTALFVQYWVVCLGIIGIVLVKLVRYLQCFYV